MESRDVTALLNTLENGVGALDTHLERLTHAVECFSEPQARTQQRIADAAEALVAALVRIADLHEREHDEDDHLDEYLARRRSITRRFRELDTALREHGWENMKPRDRAEHAEAEQALEDLARRIEDICETRGIPVPPLPGG